MLVHGYLNTPTLTSCRDQYSCVAGIKLAYLFVYQLMLEPGWLLRVWSPMQVDGCRAGVVTEK